MTKNIWVMGTLTAGVILCVFGNAAFAAVGVMMGLAGIAIGIYFLGLFPQSRHRSIVLGVGLIVVGLLVVVLCIFSAHAAFFLGGIIMAAAGIILLPVCGRQGRLLLPLCFGCMAFGVVILLAPSLIGWLSVGAGILFIIYSGVLLLYM